MKFSTLQKRLVYVCFFICFSIGIYAIIGVLDNLKSDEEPKEVTVNATPITNKVIILDAGHGLPDQRCNRF